MWSIHDADSTEVISFSKNQNDIGYIIKLVKFILYHTNSRCSDSEMSHPLQFILAPKTLVYRLYYCYIIEYIIADMHDRWQIYSERIFMFNTMEYFVQTNIESEVKFNYSDHARDFM